MDNRENRDTTDNKETGRDRWRRRLEGLDYPMIVMIAAVVAYFVVFLLMGLYRYRNYRCQMIDFAIFDQALWLMSRGKSPTVTIRGLNIFGDHMAPILFLLVPLYWIRGNVPALIVVQTAALALGAVPIYLLARKHLRSGPLAVTLSLSYLLYPALQYLNVIDFHTEVLAVPFLLFAFLFLDRERYGFFILFCGLAVLCKEDIALVVVLLGIVALIKYNRRVGALVALGSLGYMLVMVLAVMPRLGPEGYAYASRLSQFGDNPFSAFKNMVVHPGRTFRIVVTRTNVKYLVDLLAPVVFLPLIAPLVALPALAPIAVNIVSDFPPQHQIFYQYTAGIIPFVFVGAVYGVKRVISWERVARRRRGATAVIAAVLLIVALVSTILLGPSPISRNFSMAQYRGDEHVDIIREGLGLIPPEASVSSQIYLIGHLSDREDIYMFPNPFVDLVSQEYYDTLSEDELKYMFPGVYKRRLPGENEGEHPVPRVDYVVLDRTLDTWPLPRDEYERVVEGLEDHGYEKLFDREGVLILREGSNSEAE